jgi:hypothetical protein
MKLIRVIAAPALVFPLLLAASATGAEPAKAPAAPPAPAAGPDKCKTFGAGKCCSPDLTMHLAKEAVYSACGESEATFIGEAGTKDTCRYHFKVAGENTEDTFVSVYTQAVKEVPNKPTDPFFSYKKVGKVWVTAKAKSPKAAAMGASKTGLYLAGRGYFVSVVASTKVCTTNEAIALSKSLK